jgi:hypothetical protein
MTLCGGNGSLIRRRFLLRSRHLVSIRPGRMAIGEFRNRLGTRLPPRRTGERRPEGKRDEGPGETEGVLPAVARAWPRTNPGLQMGR